MVNKRTFQISDDDFWGWNMVLDLDDFDRMEDVVGHIKYALREMLMKHNLEILAERLDKKTFHGPTLGTVLVESKIGDVIYLCSHCHGAENCCSSSCTSSS